MEFVTNNGSEEPSMHCRLLLSNFALTLISQHVHYHFEQFKNNLLYCGSDNLQL